MAEQGDYSEVRLLTKQKLLHTLQFVYLHSGVGIIKSSIIITIVGPPSAEAVRITL